MSALPVEVIVPEKAWDGYGKHVSFSQVSRNCGLSLQFHRQGHKEDHKGISLAYGSAVHHGIEHYLRSGDAEASVTAGIDYLREEIAKAAEDGETPIRWDDPPRLRADGFPYRGDEGKIPTPEVAEAGIRLQVSSWCEKFGDLSVGALDDIEREIEVPIPGDEEGWTIKCRLDVPTDEGGLVDIKTSGKSWKDEEIDAKLDQAHLYHLAYLHHYGRPAEYLTFHVGLKGTPLWEVHEVPYDAEAIERVIEYRVRPTVNAIRARALVPNTSGYWHSEKFCEFWSSCPLGAKARGAGWRVA